MPAAPLYIVVNAGSGNQETDVTCREIADVLTAAGRAHELVRVEDPTRLGEVAGHAVENARLTGGAVVAVGGDGTLNAVAQATLGTGCQFGVIPQGTFNYFGRTHGISSNAAEAANALLTARVRPVQVGMVNDRLFLVNASIGMYPQLLDDREEEKRRHGRSRLVAAWAALRTIVRGYRPTRIRLEQEGRTHELRTLTLFISNNRLQLEQVGLDESETVEDGKLVAIVLRPVSTLTLLWLVMQGAMGNLGRAHGVQHFPFTRVTVKPSARGLRRLNVSTDGETAWMDTPIVFRVAPEPLLLLTPIDAVPESAT